MSSLPEQGLVQEAIVIPAATKPDDGTSVLAPASPTLSASEPEVEPDEAGALTALDEASPSKKSDCTAEHH